MNSLARRVNGVQSEGGMEIDGSSYDGHVLKGVSGYVMQGNREERERESEEGESQEGISIHTPPFVHPNPCLFLFSSLSLSLSLPLFFLL
jgi:hypothetical protein